jgi:hypothetical protein
MKYVGKYGELYFSVTTKNVKIIKRAKHSKGFISLKGTAIVNHAAL